MKVELISNHVLGVKGQHVEVTEQRAKYLVNMGVAKEVKKAKKDK